MWVTLDVCGGVPCSPRDWRGMEMRMKAVGRVSVWGGGRGSVSTVNTAHTHRNTRDFNMMHASPFLLAPHSQYSTNPTPARLPRISTQSPP